MSRQKLAITAGALILLGGAAAIAAVGQREFGGGRERVHGIDAFDLAQGPGPQDGPGRRGRFDRDDADDRRGQSDRGGWFGRGSSPDEFDARTRERFARLDRNSDGVIDAAEVEAEFTARTQGRNAGREAMRDRAQGRYDTDRDGKITRQEMLDRVKRRFARMDLDGDGRITDQDLPPMMRGHGVLKGEAGAMGSRGGGMGLSRVIAADADKDGIITLDEMLAAAGRRFDAADRNKDGVIDSADRDAMHKEMTEYMVRRFIHAYGGKDGKVTREQYFAAAKERFADMAPDMTAGGHGMGRGRGPGRGPMGPNDGPRGSDMAPGKDRGPR